jgi:hypothetical protein
MTRFFDFMKAKLDFEPVLHSTNPTDIPRYAEHSRGAGGVKGGFAGACAVRTLDTALSASAHNPNIRGMSVFPLRELSESHSNCAQSISQAKSSTSYWTNRTEGVKTMSLSDRDVSHPKPELPA